MPLSDGEDGADDGNQASRPWKREVAMTLPGAWTMMLPREWIVRAIPAGG